MRSISLASETDPEATFNTVTSNPYASVNRASAGEYEMIIRLHFYCYARVNYYFNILPASTDVCEVSSFSPALTYEPLSEVLSQANPGQPTTKEYLSGINDHPLISYV